MGKFSENPRYKEKSLGKLANAFFKTRSVSLLAISELTENCFTNLPSKSPKDTRFIATDQLTKTLPHVQRSPINHVHSEVNSFLLVSGCFSVSKQLQM